MLKRQVVEGRVGAEAGAAYVPTLGWLRAEEAATAPQEGCQTCEARAKRLGSPPTLVSPAQGPATTPGPSSGSA